MPLFLPCRLLVAAPRLIWERKNKEKTKLKDDPGEGRGRVGQWRPQALCLMAVVVANSPAASSVPLQAAAPPVRRTTLMTVTRTCESGLRKRVRLSIRLRQEKLFERTRCELQQHSAQAQHKRKRPLALHHASCRVFSALGLSSRCTCIPSLLRYTFRNLSSRYACVSAHGEVCSMWAF